LLFPSKESRDGLIASGMEHGAAASYDRLASLLAARRAGEDGPAESPCAAVAAPRQGTQQTALDAPEIAETTTQLTALIHLTVPREKIRTVMGPGIGELMSTIAAQGIAPAGPWFTHHLRVDPDIFDFEISVPVTAPVAATGRVQAGQRPAARVVRTVYHGGYEGLPAAWGEFDQWIAANGLEPGTELWECYVSGPESDPDPVTWRTELSRSLSGSARSGADGG
jgi:effector-binding domain-containing protein